MWASIPLLLSSSQDSVSEAAICLPNIHTPVFLSNKKPIVLGVSVGFLSYHIS